MMFKLTLDVTSMVFNMDYNSVWYVAYQHKTIQLNSSLAMIAASI